MRTQGDVLALLQGAVGKGLKVEVNRGAIKVVRVTSDKVTVPAPPLLATDAEAERYLGAIYKAIALAKHADAYAIARDGRDSLADPLAYEVGLRFAQARAAEDWQGDRVMLRKEEERLANVLKNTEWGEVDARSQKGIAASLASLVYSGCADSSILKCVPENMANAVRSASGVASLEGSKARADYLRSVLKLDVDEESPPTPPPSGGGDGGDGDPDEVDSSSGADEEEQGGQNGEESSDEEEEASGVEPEEQEGEEQDESKEEGGDAPTKEPMSIAPADFRDEIPNDPSETRKDKHRFDTRMGQYIVTSEKDVVYHSYESRIPSRNARDITEREWSDFPVAPLEHRELSRELRKLVQVDERVRYERGKMSGRIDPKALYRVGLPTVGDGMWNAAVFRKKHAPKNTQRTAVSILVDYSGSMSGSKTRHANAAARLLSASLAQLRVEHCINVFTETRNAGTIVSTACLEIGAIKEWGCRVSDADIAKRLEHFRITHGQKQNGDPCAISYAYTGLVRRKEPRKVLIALSDGEPCCDRPGDAYAGLKNIVAQIEKENKVEVYSIGIETDCVTEYYTNNVVINNASELEAKLIELARGIFL